MLIRSIQSCSARRKVYGDKKRQYLYLQEYLSTLKYSSDTVVALSLSKRVYAILCKHETLFLVLTPSEKVYTFLKSSEGTEKLYTAFHAVLFSSTEVYTHFGLHVLDEEDEEPP